MAPKPRLRLIVSSPRTAEKIILLRLSVVYSVLPVLPPPFLFSLSHIWEKPRACALGGGKGSQCARPPAPPLSPGFEGEEEKEACATTPEREKPVLIFPPLEEGGGGRRGSLAPKEGLSFSRSGTLELFSFTALDSFGFGGLFAVLVVVERQRRVILQKKVCFGGGSCSEIYI